MPYPYIDEPAHVLHTYTPIFSLFSHSFFTLKHSALFTFISVPHLQVMCHVYGDVACSQLYHGICTSLLSLLLAFPSAYSQAYWFIMRHSSLANPGTCTSHSMVYATNQFTPQAC